MQLIVLPGWGHDKMIWGSFERTIENCRVVDLPGFGGEKMPDQTWGVSEYADWVKDKLKSSKEVILLGHSFGGRIAAEIAAQRPKWLKGLILCGAPCIYRPEFKTKLKIISAKLFKPIVPERLRQILTPSDLKQAREWRMEAIFRNVISYDQTEKLRLINLPTLLIWGEKDGAVPLTIAKEMKGLIEGSELRTLEGAGHNCFLDNQYLFSGYVKKFIEEIK